MGYVNENKVHGKKKKNINKTRFDEFSIFLKINISTLVTGIVNICF